MFRAPGDHTFSNPTVHILDLSVKHAVFCTVV